jgi:colicin import membrane protein
MSNEVTVLPKAITPAVVYQTKGGVDDVIAKIKAEVSTFDPDVSTEAGRAEIRSMAYKVTRSKTLLDDMGKKLGEEWRLSIEKVNADRRRLREELEALAAAVRGPLTEYEEAEQRRRDAHEQAINQIQLLGEVALLRSPVTPDKSSDELEGLYLNLQKLYADRDWQEFAKRATDARMLAASRLLDAYKGAVDRENAQAEAERQRQQADEEARVAREKARQEREERLRAEAAAAAREKAEAEALARERAAKRAWEEREARIRAEAAKAEQAKKDAEAARAKAEHERQQAQARAEREAEERRIAEEARQKSEAQWAEADRRAKEAQQKAAEERQRGEDREHQEAESRRVADEANKRAQTAANKLRVQQAAISVLVENGLSRSAATLAVDLIAKGEIPGVSIRYEIRELAR